MYKFPTQGFQTLGALVQNQQNPTPGDENNEIAKGIVAAPSGASLVYNRLRKEVTEAYNTAGARRASAEAQAARARAMTATGGGGIGGGRPVGSVGSVITGFLGLLGAGGQNINKKIGGGS
jgi:hypothetical protein